MPSAAGGGRRSARGAAVLAIALAAIVAAVERAEATPGSAETPLRRVGASGRIPQSGLQFNTGHQGAVARMASWRGGSFVVSAGVDGSLRVWDPRDGSLRHAVALRGVPSALVVHPWLPRAFVALADGSGEWLAAWDWESGLKLFSIPLGDPPLFLGLSRTAGSLLVGRASFEGLWLLDPTTGERQPGLESGTGIVTFAVTSRDERTVLTYLPSGSLVYRDRATGRVRQSLRVPADLADLGLSSSRRHLVGRSGEWLMAIDAVDGAVTDRLRIGGMRTMQVWGAADRVVVAEEDESGPSLRTVSVTAGRFDATRPAWRVAETPTALSYGHEKLFAGLTDGTILTLDLRDPEPAAAVLVRDERLPILDVAAAGNTIVLGTRAGVVTIAGGFVAGAPPRLAEAMSSGMEARVLAGPFGEGRSSAIRVTALDAERVLVWTVGDEPGIAVLHLREHLLGVPHLPLPGPLANLDVTGRMIAAVDRTGRAALLAAHTGTVVTESGEGSSVPPATAFETLYAVTIPGTTDVAAATGDGGPALVAALASFGAMGTSIVSIAAATGETVAMPDPRSYVYDLAYDPHGGALYSLGVHEGAGSRTTLMRHTGAGLDQRRTLFVAAGEDLRASVAVESAVDAAAVDAAEGRVFFSLTGRVRLWDGQRTRHLVETGREARRLAVHRGRVYAANSDGTLSAWSADTLAHQFDLHLWRDFEWLLTSGDRYWTSPGGARYVRGDPDAGRGTENPAADWNQAAD